MIQLIYMKPTTVIILCAGRGTRMGLLTENCPKPLLILSTGETLLENKLHSLPSTITKIILVVGYLGEMIQKHIGISYEGKEVVYVSQDIEKAYGTGAALELCKDYLQKEESVLVLMGDDIYDKEDLEKLCQYENSILLAYKGEEKFNATWQVLVKDNVLVSFYEKVPPIDLCTGIINTAAYVLSPKYFDIKPVTGADGEVQIPPTIIELVKDGVIFNTVKASYWKQVTVSEDLVV